MMQDIEWINVDLWRADAVVLFDWLMEVDLNSVPISHKAQKQALVDLLASLEARASVDLRGVTQEEVDAARTAVARDMDR